MTAKPNVARGETGHPGGAVWAVAIVATLGMSVSYIDRQTLAAIAPQVCKALSIDNTHYGWLLSAFSMAYLVGAPIAGVVVDRLGARRGFAAAVLVWSLVAGAHALAVSFATLFALRIMLGTAEAPSFPSAAQAIRRALPGARRPLAFGLLFTGSSIGAIIAAKLAVRLEGAFGFRGAFLGTAVLGTIWIPVWLMVTRRFGLDAPAKRDVDLERPNKDIEERASSLVSVITSPPVLRSIIAIIGSAPSLMFVLNWTSKYLDAEFRVPKAEIGNYLIAAPLLFDVGAIGFGYLASQRELARRGRGSESSNDSAVPASLGPKTHNDLLLLSMILSAALALAPLVSSPWVATSLCAVSACGGGGIYALVTADMLSRVPIDRTSVAGGMTAAAQSLAHVVAAPLVGWTIDVTHSHHTALLALGLIVVPTTVAFVYWPSLRSRS